MPLTLNLGSQNIDLTNGDLVTFLISNLPAELKFLQDPGALGAGTLQQIGNQQLSLGFSTTQQLSWNLGANGNVTFGFSPSASGTVSIQTSGTLFTYNLADGSDPVVVTVPANTGYVSITFNVSLAVSAGAGFSAGNFGVSGNASASSTFALSFRKAFPLSTNLITAIEQAFLSFTLPFQPSGVSRMNDGDFLDYEYLGSILAGFGVTYGVSGSLLGGRSALEISQSFNLSPFAKAVINVQPTFQAAASFALSYDHEDVFHVIVSRQANHATLVYFRSHSNTVSTTETLGITLNAGASFNLSSQLPTAANKLAASALSGISGVLGQSSTTALATSLANDVTGEFQSYIDDVNTAVNTLLAKGDGQTIQLQALQEQQSAATALFSFEFDLTVPDALTKGYPLAIQGNFAGAIQVAGVDLDHGSFVENTWTKASSISFQFFDLFQIADVTQYFGDSTLTYLGNKQFRFMLKTGVDSTITINSAQNSVEVFFTASATVGSPAKSVSDLLVSLNFTLIDHTTQAAQQTKRALNFIGGSALQTAASAIPNTLSGLLTVNCQFPKSAFSKFNCDEYSGKKPSPLPHPIDAANYVTFLAAVHGIVPPDNVDADFLRLFASYDSWVEFNRVKIDQEGSQMTPDRKQTGNEAVSVWPDALDNIDTDERILLQCYIYAAQSVMNLCESLKHLANDAAAASSDNDLKLLTDSLNTIIHQNIPVFFIKPTLAALFRASQSSSTSVQVTQSGGNIGISFVADIGAAVGRALRRAA